MTRPPLKQLLSFGSLSLLVGALGITLLLLWGWLSGQTLPLWPALLVVAVNVFGAYKLLQETKARQAAAREQAAAAAVAPPPAAGRPKSGKAR